MIFKDNDKYIGELEAYIIKLKENQFENPKLIDEEEIDEIKEESNEEEQEETILQYNSGLENNILTVETEDILKELCLNEETIDKIEKDMVEDTNVYDTNDISEENELIEKNFNYIYNNLNTDNIYSKKQNFIFDGGVILGLRAVKGVDSIFENKKAQRTFSNFNIFED